RDLSAGACALWQAFWFGAAHSSIYRFVPTGMLGGFQALLALRARSVWPCVVLHATFNALLVLRESCPWMGSAYLAWLALPGLALLWRPAGPPPAPGAQEPPRFPSLRTASGP